MSNNKPEAAYRHLSSQPSPGLRLVKASERLPDEADHWKANNLDQEGRIVLCRVESIFAIGHFFRTKNTLHFSYSYKFDNAGCWDNENNGYVAMADFDKIEWLEETPSVQPIEGENDVDKFETLKQDGLAYLVDPALRPEAQPIADSKEVPVKTWPLAGYAPGNYSSKCVECGNVFVGDKRAVQCLECAVRLSQMAFDQQRIIIAAKETQIAGLLESNKEWGDKYVRTQQEANDYLNELNIITGDMPDNSTMVARIRKTLSKYISSPIDKANGRQD